MTTIGYGELVPQSNSEILIGIFIMLISSGKILNIKTYKLIFF